MCAADGVHRRQPGVRDGRRHGGWCCRCCGARSGPSRLSEGSNPLHCGVGGLLAPRWPAPGRGRRRPARPRPAPGASCARSGPSPCTPQRWAAAAPRARRRRRTPGPPARPGAGLGRVVGEGLHGAAQARGAHRRAARREGRERHRRGSSLHEFHGLLELATARWARMQHEPRWLTMARLRGRDPLKKFQAAARSLGERFRVSIASVDGRPVAGLVVLQGRNAYYFRGAMDETMRDHRPNDLLHARAIEDACAARCGAYYMGDSGWSPVGGGVQGAVRRPTGALPRVPLRAPAALAHRAGRQDGDQEGHRLPGLLRRVRSPRCYAATTKCWTCRPP